MAKVKDISGKRVGKLIVVKCIGRKGYHALWQCKCDCGNTTNISAEHLNGKRPTQSCGCGKAKPPINYTANGESNFNRLHKIYQKMAKEKGRVWELTREEVYRLFSSNCYYCGIAPYKVKQETKNNPFLYNGIDRVDNSKGYTSDNVVSCCERCNLAKRAMTEQEFLSWVKQVYEHRVVSYENLLFR